MKTFNNIELSYQTDPYATHQPALIWALENTVGDILELGTGQNSTLLLHSGLKNNNRKLTSVDDNQEWLTKFDHLKNKNHEFIFIESTLLDWNQKIDELSKLDWGLVFIDHASLENIWRISRPYAIEKLINSCEYIVAHDADLFPEIKNKNYNYYEYIPTQKPMPSRNGPSTYILSTRNNISFDPTQF